MSHQELIVKLRSLDVELHYEEDSNTPSGIFFPINNEIYAFFTMYFSEIKNISEESWNKI